MDAKSAVKSACAADYSWLKVLVKYLTAGLAFACAWRVTVGDAHPFATGLMIALAFTPGVCATLAAPLYVLTAFAATADFRLIISAVIAAVACVAASVLRSKCRGRRAVFLAAFVAVAAESGFLWTGFCAGSKLYAPLGALFSLCFAFTAYRAVSGAVAAGVKPTDADFAGLGIVLCVLSAGAFTVEIYGVKIGYALAVFAAGITCGLTGKGAGLFAAVCAGAGGAITLQTPEPLALTAFVAAAYLTFSDAIRLLAAVAAVMAAVLFELYFFLDPSALPPDMIAFFAGGALYAAIPAKAIRAVRDARFTSVTGLAFRYVTERKNAEFAAKVRGLSEIFSDMRRALTAGAPRSGLSPEEIATEVENGICGRCSRRDDCDGRTEALAALSGIAAKNGRASALDVPYFVENDCPNTARFLSVTAEYAAASREKNEANAADTEFREALGRQLQGVSGALAKAADDMRASPEYDGTSERALKTEFGENTVAVFVKNKNASPEEIAAVTGRTLGGEYAVRRVERCALPGYSMVEMREKPPFDAVFAVAGSSKNRSATGDTHSFVRVGANRFMAALCDGMGSGREAGRISETAVELVESFFRAGFPGEFVLEEVNRFLSVGSGESFAAFDILLCDLFTRERTLIKLGSPASYIRTSGGTTAVEGSALPLGALESISPFVRTDEFGDGDIVVFASDGVTDLFQGEELKILVNETSGDNVETLVNAVMAEAKRRTGEANRDDMTVTAVRIFKRN